MGIAITARQLDKTQPVPMWTQTHCLGVDCDNAPEVKAGVNYISKQKLKALQSTPYYMYGHYYAALVMYQTGPAEFERWYPSIRDILLARQADNGSFVTGSGKITYDTAIAALILSIPYGYVPAYQR